MAPPILLAPEYARCRDELELGQLKRIPARGQLVGVFMRCPDCRALLAFTSDAIALVEHAGPPPRPLSVSGCACRACGSQISTVEGRLCTSRQPVQ